MDQWFAVADEIRQGRCNVQRLTLGTFDCSRSEDTRAAKAVASAIRSDCNLEHLTLEMKTGFSDEAGVALAEALTVNKTLLRITLSVPPVLHQSHYIATLRVPAHEALATILRLNTSLVIEFPPLNNGRFNERFLESRQEMCIEQRLNQVGRGRLLASRQTTREEYVDALHELSSCNFDDSPAFKVSCMYCLLQLQPAVCRP
jgi:hypothetical protein